MFNVIRGKGAMVWRLREWEDGNPQQQTAAALQMGLDWVSLKMLDGTDTRWENESLFPDNQNDDLLAETIAALREQGITVIAWIYSYGRDPERRWGTPSVAKGIAEAETIIRVANEYGIKHVQLDAEYEYRDSRMAAVAEALCQRLNRDGPEIEYSLCSYRYPTTHQPSFPVHVFAPHMDAMCPQVYFIEDSRLDGGAIQLQLSFDHYREHVTFLPFFPIFPTYRWVNPVTREPWTASGNQLKRAFQRAVDLGLPAAAVWDLPQANAEQIAALTDFEWPDDEEPPTPRPGDFAQRLRSLAAELQENSGAEIQSLEEVIVSYRSEIESIADELENA